MPDVDERLSRIIDRIAEDVPMENVLPKIQARRRTRRLLRRARVAALVLVVLAGTIGGSFALARAFMRSGPSETPVHPGPSGEHIVFLRVAGDSTDVFITDPSGGPARRLTNDQAYESDPAWSPNGRTLAFVRDGSIFLLEADGSGLRSLTSNPVGSDQDPEWSPDGRSIAFTRSLERSCEGDCPPPTEDVLPHLYVIDSDGTGLQAISDGPFFDHDPTWSPDESDIAFVRSEPEIETIDAPGISLGSDLLSMVGLDGSEIRNVTILAGPVNDLAWSPDGSRLLYSAEPRLYTVAPDGSAVTEVPGALESNEQWNWPAWSPDGNLIVFRRSIGVEDQATGGLYVVRPDGTGLRQLTSDPKDCCPAWGAAPDSNMTTTGPVTPAVSAPPGGLACFGADVSGDFDGDGRMDEALVYPKASLEPPVCAHEVLPSWTQVVAISLASGSDLHFEFECTAILCRFQGWNHPGGLFMAPDFDGDGRAELAISVSQGATFSLFTVFRVTPQGLQELQLVPPGDPKGQLNQELNPGPIRLLELNDLYFTAGVSCERAEDGSRVVVQERARRVGDSHNWRYHKTVLAFDGKSFTVVSSRNATVSSVSPIFPHLGLSSCA